MKMKYCAPITITLSTNHRLVSVYSVDDAIGVDISGCEYADLVTFRTIIDSTPTDVENVSFVKDSALMNKARTIVGDECLGVLLLYMYANTVLLIIDDEREMILNVVG